MVYRIALVRHGQSKFNLEKKFTGWTDVDLTHTGDKEAIQVSPTDHCLLTTCPTGMAIPTPVSCRRESC